MKRPTAIIVAGLIALFGYGLFRTLASAPAPTQSDATPSVLVDTQILQPGSLPASLSAYGSLQPGPDADQIVSMAGGGIISSIKVIAGEPVSKDQALAEIVPDPQSLADYKKAVSAVTVAEANRSHVAALLATHLATNADLATADQGLADAQGALAALKATGAGMPRTVNAPFAGVVGAIAVAPGSLQPAGTAILHLMKSNALSAMIGVAPAQASAINPQDHAAVRILGTDRTIPGHVMQITHMADPQTGLFTAAIALDTQNGVNAGTPVEAMITTGTWRGYVVPRDAVQNDEKGDYIFIADAKNIAHRVAVHIIGKDGDKTVIAPDDVKPGTILITTGAYQLDDGAAVRMADQSVGAGSGDAGK